MSLINQMLMDLEKRRAPRPDGVLSQARALPTQLTRDPRWRFALIALIALALAAAVFTWVTKRGITLPLPSFLSTPAQAPTPPTPTTKEETPPPLPANANVPVQAATAPAAPAPTVEKALKDNPVVSESLLEPASRLSLELSTATQEPERAVSKPAAKAKSVAQPPVAAKVKPAAEQPSPPGISKQVRQETPQQLAEEEYRKAVVSLQQGQQVEAQEGFRRALQFDPNFTASRLALAGLLLQGRQMAEAERVLRKGLELDNRQPGFAMMLARVQLDKGDIRAALETLRRTLPYTTGNADYHALMAALLLRDARYTDSVEHYRTALSLKPAGVWYMGLGVSLQALQRLPEAHDAFQKAMESGELNPELRAFVEQRLKQISLSKKQATSD
jgi:MSHA biogenesis protein MshN